MPAHSTQTLTIEDAPGYDRCGTRSYDRSGGQWWLRPQNQAPPASMSERKYDLTYTQSCVLAIVTD